MLDPTTITQLSLFGSEPLVAPTSIFSIEGITPDTNGFTDVDVQNGYPVPTQPRK